MALPTVHREGKTAYWCLHSLELHEPGRSATLQLPPTCRHHGCSPSSKAELVFGFTNLSAFQNEGFLNSIYQKDQENS